MALPRISHLFIILKKKCVVKWLNSFGLVYNDFNQLPFSFVTLMNHIS